MNKAKVWAMAFVTVLLLGSVAAYGVAAQKADPANGKKLFAACVSCHSAQGKWVAGKPVDKLVRAMQHFQTGSFTKGRDKRMQALLKPMSQKELMDLATYMNSL